MKQVFFLTLAILIVGCGRSSTEVICSGQPTRYWVEALKNPDARLRLKAVKALGNIGPADAPAIPALIEALKDEDPRIRAEAAVALHKNASEAQEASYALNEALYDQNEHVRVCAAKALEKIQGSH